MTEKSYDPIAFKSKQKESWNAASNGWLKWWEVMEKSAQPVSDKIVDLAGLQDGHRVLDLATGIGEPAVTAARQVGAKGHVLAMDQATQMLAFANERANKLGLTNISFRESDCEDIDVDESSFDAVISRWGLMFFPDLEGALAKIHNALVPGGRLAAAVWDIPPKVPMISLFTSVASTMINMAPAPGDQPSPFALANTEKLKQSLSEAGFQDVQIERLTVTYDFPSAESYVNFSKDIGATANAILKGQTDDIKNKVWEALTEEVRRFESADQSIQIPNECICVSGRKLS